jgi:hypothetical protein
MRPTKVLDMVCILNDKMYLRMDIIATVRNNFL